MIKHPELEIQKTRAHQAIEHRGDGTSRIVAFGPIVEKHLVDGVEVSAEAFRLIAAYVKNVQEFFK